MDNTLIKLNNELHSEWLSLRDDLSKSDMLNYTINFLHKSGIISSEIAELWLLRIEKCPGHDNESGRQWCAYCGYLNYLNNNVKQTVKAKVIGKIYL